MSAPLAVVPALPLHTAGKYVAGAYVVAFVLVLVYVAIMSIRLSRMESELGALLERAEEPSGGHDAGEGAYAAPGGPGGHERPAAGADRASAYPVQEHR